MIEETDSLLDGLSRVSIDFSSKLAEPFCWAYGFRHRFVSPLDPNKFDNTSSKVKEIAIRVFIFAAAAAVFTFAGTIHIPIALVATGVGVLTFRAIGFALRKHHFTHVRGSAPEKVLENGQASVMVWDLCGEWGRQGYRKGVIPWRSRFDGFIDKIKTDVIVLHGINDTALAEALIESLKDRYAHFFMHMGGSAFHKTNGCMVISKCAIGDSFSHKDLPNQASYETFEIKAHPDDALPCLRIIATQLIPGKDQEAKRMEQVTHIVGDLAKKTLVLPTLFVSTNADRDSSTEGAFLSKYFLHSYRAPEPTHTDELAIQWDPALKEGKSFDVISLFKRNLIDGTTLPVSERNIRMVDCHVVGAFDSKTFDTQSALSNDDGIVTIFRGLKAAQVTD